MVEVGDDVAALFGQLELERIVAEAHEADFVCVRCKVAGAAHAGDRVSVLVVELGERKVIQFAHQDCVPSQVVIGDEPGAGDGPQAADVITYALLVPSVGGPRPFLCLQVPMPVTMLTPGGDMIDPAVNGLLARGWSLFSALGRTPPAVPDWVLELDPATGTGRVTGPDDELLDRMPPLPPGWADLVVDAGQVAVLAGQLDLADVPKRGVRAVADAVRRGGAVAATVPVRVATAPPRSQGQIAGELADELRKAISERARPGNPAEGGRLNNLPELVPLPTLPTLHVIHNGPDEAAVFVDLNDPDPARAACTITGLKGQGLRPYSADGGPPPMTRNRWMCILWRSQLLVMDVQDRDNPKKLFFEPVDISPELYELTRRAGAIIILVANLRAGDHLDEQTFNAALDRGDVLGVGLFATVA